MQELGSILSSSCSAETHPDNFSAADRLAFNLMRCIPVFKEYENHVNPGETIKPDEALQIIRSGCEKTEASSDLKEHLFSSLSSCIGEKETVLVLPLLRQINRTAYVAIAKLSFENILGVKVIGDFSIPPRDCRRLQHSFSSEDSIDCQRFAFYYLNDQVILKDFLETDGRNFLGLFCLSYEPVFDPEPGDLVAFRKADSETPLHFGVWKSNGWLLSKWGFKFPLIEHQLKHTPPDYGNLAGFYRKKVKFPFFRSLIAELENASAKTADFSHILTRSPLSAMGTQVIFLSLLNRCAKQEEKNAFSQSLYGKRAVKNLTARIIMQVNAIKISESMSKEQLLQKIEEIASTETRELPLDFSFNQRQ